MSWKACHARSGKLGRREMKFLDRAWVIHGEKPGVLIRGGGRQMEPRAVVEPKAAHTQASFPRVRDDK